MYLGEFCRTALNFKGLSMELDGFHCVMMCDAELRVHE